MKELGISGGDLGSLTVAVSDLSGEGDNGEEAVAPKPKAKPKK